MGNIIVFAILILMIVVSFSKANKNFDEIIKLKLDKIDKEKGMLYCLDYSNKVYYFYIKDITSFDVEIEEREDFFVGTETTITRNTKYLTFLFNRVKFKIKDISDNQIDFLFKKK